jgi:hypothetical protein
MARNREDYPALYDIGERQVRGRDMLKGVLRTMRETRRMFAEKRMEFGVTLSTTSLFLSGGTCK